MEEKPVNKPHINLDEKLNSNNIILLNSLPASAFKNMRKAAVYIEYLGRLSKIQEDVINAIQTRMAASFISHESTAKLIGAPRNMTGTYQARPGDAGLILTLAKAMRGPGDVKVTADDIDVYFFRVSNRW